MSFSRRQLLIGGVTGLGGVALSGALASCGSGANSQPTSGPVTLSMLYWGSDVRTGLTNKAIALIQDKIPGLTLKSDSVAFTGWGPKLASQVAANQPPDVIQMSVNGIALYNGKGVLADLKAEGFDLSDIPAPLLKMGTVDGKLVAVPFGLATPALYYDTDVLKAAGMTDKISSIKLSWDDLAEVAQACTTVLKSGSYGTARFGVQDFSGQITHMEIWMREHGVGMYTADQKSLGFTKGQLTEWYTYWDKLRKSGAATDAAATSASFATSAEVTGATAIASGNGNQLAAFQSTTKHKLALAIVPLTPGSPPGRSLNPTMYLCVAAKSAAVRTAVKVTSLFLNDLAVNAALGIERGVPAATKVAAAAGSSLDDIGKATVEYVERFKSLMGEQPPLPPPAQATVSDAVSRWALAVASGQKSIADGVDGLFDEAKKALNS